MAIRMFVCSLLATVAAACTPTRYYVAAVYHDGDQVYVKKCVLPHQATWDTYHCRIEPAQPMSAVLAEQRMHEMIEADAPARQARAAENARQ
jgi:hypothetical protein